jgi:hypothetical protein
MAREFNGSSQFLDFASDFIGAYPYSVSAWFNSDTIGANQSIFSVGQGDPGTTYHALQAAGGVGSDPIRFIRYDGSGHSAVTSTGYSQDTWHHAACVVASATSTAAFIDGGSKGTDSDNIAYDGSFDEITIGVNARSRSAYMDGSVAELAIWNIALDDAEVAMLAAGIISLRVRPQNLIAWLPLWRDEDEDYVGNRSFTANNSPTIDEHYPPIIRLSPKIYKPPSFLKVPVGILKPKRARVPIPQLQL